MLELFFQSATKVLLAGLVLGAGLPAVFALGVRFSAAGAGATTATREHGRLGPRVLAAACFLIVVLVVVLGIAVVVATGFGQAISFAHVYPTLVDAES